MYTFWFSLTMFNMLTFWIYITKSFRCTLSDSVWLCSTCLPSESTPLRALRCTLSDSVWLCSTCLPSESTPLRALDVHFLIQFDYVQHAYLDYESTYTTKSFRCTLSDSVWLCSTCLPSESTSLRALDVHFLIQFDYVQHAYLLNLHH